MHLSNSPEQAAAQAPRPPHRHARHGWARNLYPTASARNARRRCDRDEDSRRAVSDDPVVHVVRAALELIYAVDPLASSGHLSDATLYKLITFGLELNYAVITRASRARVDELRREALGNVRQVLRAFLRELEKHRDGLERGAFTGDALR